MIFEITCRIPALKFDYGGNMTLNKRTTTTFLLMVFLIFTTTFSTTGLSANSPQKGKSKKAAKKEDNKVTKESKKTAEPVPAPVVEKVAVQTGPPETIGKPAIFEDRGDIA